MVSATRQEVWDIARLYEGALDRDGNIDRTGLNYWVDVFEAGEPIRTISRSFLYSGEFTRKFGPVDALSDAQFVDLLYQNILERGPDFGGFDYWTGVLARGESRANVLLNFATSPENERETAYVEDIAQVLPGEWDYPDRNNGDTLASGPETTARLALDNVSESAIDYAGDSDWYATTLQGGRDYLIELVGVPGQQPALVDPYLEIYDEFERSVAVDDDGAGFDASLVFTPRSSGTYFLSAEAFADGTGSYQISLDDLGPPDPLPSDPTTPATLDRGGLVADAIDFAGDEDWIAVDLVQGYDYTFTQFGVPDFPGELDDPLLRLYDAGADEVALDDDSGPGLNARLDFTPGRTDTFYLSAGAFDVETGAYEVGMAYSEDEGVGDASVDLGGSYFGFIDFAGDEDWIRTELPGNALIAVDVFGETLEDPVLSVRDATGAEIAFNDDFEFGDPDPGLTFATDPGGGTYFMAVSAFDDGTGSYDLVVS